MFKFFHMIARIYLDVSGTTRMICVNQISTNRRQIANLFFCPLTADTLAMVGVNL